MLTAYPTTARYDGKWTWEDSQGRARTRADLDKVLSEHREWESSQRKSGGQADLHGADLGGADLDGAHLEYADLHDADLVQAHLHGANLLGANLARAGLNGSDLSGAILYDANLDDARLYGANLLGANLHGAHMNGANLNGVDLHDVYLSDAHLDGATMFGAQLDGAHLQYAHLNGADLRDANLVGAHLYGADFAGAKFEPKSLPELREVASTKNLELLTYVTDPDALVQLRKQLEDGGFRELERKITYALKRREAELSWMGCRTRGLPDGKTRAILWSSDSNLANCASFVLNKVFFDLTCQYGMSPGRPLSLGVVLWFVCSVLYFVCIRAPGDTGLYRVYAQSIERGTSAHRSVEKISPAAVARTPGVRWLVESFCREWAVVRTSMLFSLMSAFNIGFRDINFGRWLRLLTRQEYDIKALGWARVVAGWQSLISVYLLALWVLTYFGRPFE
ncbi:MAG TPA: pentapeptide repeat-containing protein [Candidatus Acidoferrum sp.]|nr:pentapeptide repeat-containing protein [Candidatus Acidoferrum sp.]